MTVIDLDALEALAKNATPGPWSFEKEHNTCYLRDETDCLYSDSPIIERTEWHEGVDGTIEDAFHHVHASYEAHYIEPHVAGNYDYEQGGIIETRDTEYIAAADPPTVLALIARLRRAEECIKKLREVLADRAVPLGASTWRDVDRRMAAAAAALADYDEEKADE